LRLALTKVPQSTGDFMEVIISYTFPNISIMIRRRARGRTESGVKLIQDRFENTKKK
jgi:hypothetical protein